MNKTEIPWTDFTWTVSRGCSPVSAGCDNCYAAKMASRFAGPGNVYEGLAKGGEWTGRVELCSHNLKEPLYRKAPAKIFVNSMSDLFHKGLPRPYIAGVFGVMAGAPQHTFQVLTKRPERMRKWFEWITPNELQIILDHADEFMGDGGSSMFSRERGLLKYGDRWPLPNVWLGATVENQEQADKRIPILLGTPAAVRFISVEPMLEPIDLTKILLVPKKPPHGPEISINALIGLVAGPDEYHDKLNWVIVGCESGPGARPCEMDWIKSIRDQCFEAGVPLFVKQARIDGKLVKMPEIDGVIYNQYPEAA